MLHILHLSHLMVMDILTNLTKLQLYKYYVSRWRWFSYYAYICLIRIDSINESTHFLYKHYLIIMKNFMIKDHLTRKFNFQNLKKFDITFMFSKQ